MQKGGDALESDDSGEDEENDPKAANKGLSKKLSKTTKAKKFKGISSVGQLKHLLRNYDALVESQHALLTQSISKMAKIPAPDEL